MTDGRTARRTLLLALTTAVPLIAVGGPALADPVYPSQGDVDAAKAAADATAAQVDSLQAQLNTQQDQLEAAQTSLSVATEDYDEAVALLDQRTTEATAATKAAADAAAAYDQARIAVGQLASQRYRGSAGDYSALTSVLASGSISQYVDGKATLDHLAGGRADVQAEAAAAKSLAESTAAAAADAKEAQQDATDATAAAQEKARKAADATAAVVADTQAKTDALVAQLAQLQQTSVALEQQRQAGLEAERQAAAAAAAKAAAEAAARAASSTSARSSSSSSSSGSASVRRAAGPTAGADTAVDWALSQLGKPYLWAGDGPDSFDCSGLTMRAWQAAGVSLPHSSRIQYTGEAKVDLGDLEAGDLVFYATNTANPGTIHHVGMVIAPGTMVEAPHTGANVRTSSIYRSGLMPYGTRPA